MSTIFIRSDDLRSWFVRHEVMLFRHRWDMAGKEEKQAFIAASDFDFVPIPYEEKQSLAPFLKASSYAIAEAFDRESFFKVV
jgi:hypothetical protein